VTGFARDPGTQAYYDARAGEYDEWYESEGVFATRDRPGWDDELANVVSLVAALPAARTLDVACGTGFLTRRTPPDGPSTRLATSSGVGRAEHCPTPASLPATPTTSSVDVR
jgi:hypothetical protein